MGAVLENYYSIGHHSLDNYIAEISGQAPDPDTQEDCPVWVPFGRHAKVRGPYDQVTGNGCVYPASVQTLGNQLSARHLSWAAYMHVLSPFVKPGTVSTVDYNHYSLLRSIEDIFGLSHLGDAAMPQVKSFGPDVYTRR
jgi:hypothetical protein